MLLYVLYRLEMDIASSWESNMTIFLLAMLPLLPCPAHERQGRIVSFFSWHLLSPSR